jgi:nitrogen fixation protein NifB
MSVRPDLLPASPPPSTGEAAPQAAANCAFSAGCGAPPGAGLPPDVAGLVRNHPCYSEEAHHHFARLHLAVAPGCNLQCNYCNRKFDCANESRPGVVSARLTPAQAVAKVQAVAAEVPELSVVGIAGPGDPLADPAATFATLEGVRAVAPDLVLCLSTNGLALPLQVARIAALGVRHVTVTVNMTDPEVGARIYPWIIWNGRRVRGAEASRILSERQLLGIARLVERGVLVKVNAVVIPGVNDAHLPTVVRRVRALGAFTVNLIPLLSAPEHGTRFGLTGQRGPTAAELEAIQATCAVEAKLMRHCRQCRADAVGKLSQDRFAEFTTRTAAPPAPAREAAEVPPRGPRRGTRLRREDLVSRAAHREVVEEVRLRAERARREEANRLAQLPETAPIRVAVATRGGGAVNQHFGHASEFLVYQVGRNGASLLGVRKVEHYCQGGDGDDDALAGTLRALDGCRAVLVAKIGRCPSDQLSAAGIEPVTAHAFQPIEAALLAWYRDRSERGVPDPDAEGARAEVA